MGVTIIDLVNDIPAKDEKAVVTLSYEDDYEGWHCGDGFIDDAVNNTDTATRVAELVADTELQVVMAYGNESAIEVLREHNLQEDYVRGDEDFVGFIGEQIRENFHDLDEFIEYEVEQYDHKRGRCTISAEFKTTLENLKKSPAPASGWTAKMSYNGRIFSADL
jgi:hypothetical protein